MTSMLLPSCASPASGSGATGPLLMLASSSRVCLLWFSFPSFPWGGNNLKTLFTVFSARPSPMPRAVMPEESKCSQFNPHTELFPQFFPIPVLQGMFLLMFTTSDGWWVTRGDIPCSPGS